MQTFNRLNAYKNRCENDSTTDKNAKAHHTHPNCFDKNKYEYVFLAKDKHHKPVHYARYEYAKNKAPKGKTNDRQCVFDPYGVLIEKDHEDNENAAFYRIEPTFASEDDCKAFLGSAYDSPEYELAAMYELQKRFKDKDYTGFAKLNNDQIKSFLSLSQGLLKTVQSEGERAKQLQALVNKLEESQSNSSQTKKQDLQQNSLKQKEQESYNLTQAKKDRDYSFARYFVLFYTFLLQDKWLVALAAIITKVSKTVNHQDMQTVVQKAKAITLKQVMPALEKTYMELATYGTKLATTELVPPLMKVFTTIQNGTKNTALRLSNSTNSELFSTVLQQLSNNTVDFASKISKTCSDAFRETLQKNGVTGATEKEIIILTEETLDRFKQQCALIQERSNQSYIRDAVFHQKTFLELVEQNIPALPQVPNIISVFKTYLNVSEAGTLTTPRRDNKTFTNFSQPKLEAGIVSGKSTTVAPVAPGTPETAQDNYAALQDSNDAYNSYAVGGAGTFILIVAAAASLFTWGRRSRSKHRSTEPDEPDEADELNGTPFAPNFTDTTPAPPQNIQRDQGNTGDQGETREPQPRRSRRPRKAVDRLNM